MTNENELEIVKKDLTLVQQQSEIMNLRFELKKLQEEKVSKLQDSLLSAALFPHYKEVSETLAKSDMVPKDYRGKPENVLVAMEMGYQLGLPIAQCLQDIAVINGRPALWGDGLLALALSHPECKGIREEPIYDGAIVIGYTCTVTRKGHEPHTKSFTLQEAKQAGLLGKTGPWTQYPQRMLQMRARVAIKDKFADALRGFKVVEIDEYDDAKIIDGEIINNNQTTQVDKLKKLLQSNNGIEEVVLKPDENGTKVSISTDTGEISNNQPISSDTINKIEILMDEKDFSDERKKSALKHFRVSNLSDLTQSKGQEFLELLGKA